MLAPASLGARFRRARAGLSVGAGRELYKESRAEGGFTLIEILVVMAIVVLIAGGATRGIRSLAKSDLRTAANHMSGAVRFLFDRASTTGKYHRLVIDLDEGRYWGEVSDDRFYVPRERETELSRAKDKEDAEREEEEAKRKAEDLESSGGYDLSIVQQPEDFRPARARFGGFKDMALKKVTLTKAKVAGVFTPRLMDPRTSGTAYLYFFPMGQTEAAYIHLMDREGEHSYSLVVHPLTGRVKVYDHHVQPPLDDHYDDEGNRIER